MNNISKYSNIKLNIDYVNNLKNLPMGAVHHAHFSGYVRYSKVLDCLKEKYKNQVIFKNNELSLGKSNEKIDYERIRIKIKRHSFDFNVLGRMFYNIIKNVEFLDDYFDLILSEMNDDNIMHIDLRIKLGSYFRDNDRNKISIKEELDLFQKQYKKFIKLNKSFSIIATESKRKSFEKIRKTFNYLDNLSQFDDLIKGYDIVGDEKTGFRLTDYGDAMSQFNKPFYFHAGESDDRIDNIYYAVNNNTTRIAHGVHVLKDSYLLDLVIRRKIVLEICPLSNIGLNVVKDNLIYKKLIDRGAIITISPDDPNKMDDTNLVDNFIFLLKKGGFNFQDIFKCIENSILYSLTNDSRKKKMMKEFENQVNFSFNFSFNRTPVTNFFRKGLYRYIIFDKIKSEFKTKIPLSDRIVISNIEKKNTKDPVYDLEIINKKFPDLLNKIKNKKFSNFSEKNFTRLDVREQLINYNGIDFCIFIVDYLNEYLSFSIPLFKWTSIKNRILPKFEYNELRLRETVISTYLRYTVLDTYNLRIKINNETLKEIKNKFNPVELFSSIFIKNKYFKYVGLFYDLEFSLDSWHYKNYGNYFINLPLSEKIIEKIMVFIESELNNSEKELNFLVIVPKLNNKKLNIDNKLKKHLLFQKKIENMNVVNYLNNQIEKVCDVNIIFFSNKNIQFSEIQNIFSTNMISSELKTKIKSKKHENNNHFYSISYSTIKKPLIIKPKFQKLPESKPNKFINLEKFYIDLSCKNSKQIDFIGINEDTGSLIFYRNQKNKNQSKINRILNEHKFLFNFSFDIFERNSNKKIKIKYKNNIPYDIGGKLIPLIQFNYIEYIMFSALNLVPNKKIENLLTIDLSLFNHIHFSDFNRKKINAVVNAFIIYQQHKNPENVYYTKHDSLLSSDFYPNVNNINAKFEKMNTKYDTIFCNGSGESIFKKSFYYFSEHLCIYVNLIQIYTSLLFQKKKGDLHIWNISIYHKVTHDLIFLLSTFYEKIILSKVQPESMSSTITCVNFKGITKIQLNNISKTIETISSKYKKYGENINLNDMDLREKYCIKKPMFKTDIYEMVIGLIPENKIPKSFQNFIDEYLIKTYEIMKKKFNSIRHYKNLIKYEKKFVIDKFHQKNDYKSLMKSIEFAKKFNFNISNNKHYLKFLKNNKNV
jgi:adenosine deaminase